MLIHFKPYFSRPLISIKRSLFKTNWIALLYRDKLGLSWPERAGGRSRCGWARTCNLLSGPRWYRWRPSGRASPQPCRYKEWEPAQREQSLGSDHTDKVSEQIAGKIAVLTLTGWICPCQRDRRRAELKCGRRQRSRGVVLCCFRSLVKAGKDFWNRAFEIEPRTAFIWACSHEL